jgi:hypothetical protein
MDQQEEGKRGRGRPRQEQERISTSVRLTPEAKRLVTAIQAKMGFSSESAVWEMAIREMAERKGVK